ncbi:MAG: UDP-N-acetylmuramoyl-L-alanine--D-glutamate ligase [Pseudomonadota bacterium]
MIDLSQFRGRSFGVLGLGRTGMATADALKAADVKVVAWDDGLVGRSWAERGGIPLRRFATEGLGDIDTLVLSPGIPRGYPRPHPVVQLALDNDVRLISDIDLLAEAKPEANFIGITGTNGKSTTTSLIGHLLANGGSPAEAGGNLGRPALSLASLGADGWYVLEVSSYQLETIEDVPWSTGVFLNITPDHLDRYPDMDGYIAAKRRLFEGKGNQTAAIVGVDDEPSRKVANALEAAGRRVVPISAIEPVDGGVSAVDGKLVDAIDSAPIEVFDLVGAPALPGQHNWQNAAAAYAACRVAGLPSEKIVPGLATFPGLMHRQQTVAHVSGIRFVNDSKATNPDAAAKALGSYDTVYWIAGGRPKGTGFESLAPHLKRIRHAFLIGEAASDLAAFIDGASKGGCVPHSHCTDLDAATSAAFDAALADGAENAVVLLAPACTSWDQFVDFEARGEAFIASVTAIAHRHQTQTLGGAA